MFNRINVLHRAEEALRDSGKVVLFESTLAGKPSMGSAELLRILINETIAHPRRWTSDVMLLESGVVDVLRYKRNRDQYIDFELSEQHLVLMDDDSFRSNQYGELKYNSGGFSLYIEQGAGALMEASISSIDVLRLTTLLFQMPDELVEYALAQLVLKPSTSTRSAYSLDGAQLRISEHWGVNPSCRLVRGSIVPASKTWAVGVLRKQVGANRYYDIVQATNQRSLRRTAQQKRDIIGRLINVLQGEDGDSCQVQVEQLEALAQEL